LKTKWYENVGQTKGDNYISSRIRLARNWEEYAFPNRLDPYVAGELVGRISDGLDDIGTVEGRKFTVKTLDRIKETERLAMKERRLMNGSMVQSKAPLGIMLSEEEDVSIVINGDDHIRLQLLAPGMVLGKLWERADALDDFIGGRFPYAFDEKYGYLTSYPTNVGTGMRANAVVHLPTLSKSDESRNFINALSKLGVNISGVYGNGRENYGALYDISNTKTLGIRESEIIHQVMNVAAQLNEKENELREAVLDRHYVLKQDEAFRAYGILKYARTIRLNTALMYLSQIRTGIADGLMELEEECSIYQLMLKIQNGNLLMQAEKPMDQREMDILRANYLRAHLPKIKEA